mgnify:FL=1
MKNKRVILAIVLPCVLFALLLTLDLVSKHLIDKSLGTVGASKEIIHGFISFIYVHNSGAAWGIFSGRPIFLIIISIIVIALFIAFYVLRLRKFKDKISLWLSVSLGFIAGGCFGNLIDRTAFGYVRDFINFDFMNFPVFNVADICLTVGIILLFIYFIFFYSKEEKLLKTESVSAISSSTNNNKSSEEHLQKSSNEKVESAINEKQNLEEDTSKVDDVMEQNQIQNANQVEDLSTDDKIDSDKNAK